MVKRINLHDALKRSRYDHAVICTFSFEPRFFEDYCLDRLGALVDNNNVTVLLDRGVHDALLTCPASEWPRLANVRYLLHPIRVPGVFHPKLALFATARKALLLVGSANFTRAGLTTNAEMIGMFEVDIERSTTHLSLFRQATAFLLALSERWPHPDLVANIREMTAEAPWLLPDATAESPSGVRLISNLVEPLWNQITTGLPTSVEELHILSRYFDAEPKLLRFARSALQPRLTTVWTQNGVTTLTPAWFLEPAVKAKQVLIKDVPVFDGDYAQSLHAKALAIVDNRKVRLAYGSANFSRAGLMATAANGNVETMVLIEELPLDAGNPARMFDPSRKATLLTGLAQLQSAPRDLVATPVSHPIALSYVGLTGAWLNCQLTLSERIPSPELAEAVLNFGDGSEEPVRVFADAGSYAGRLSDTQVRRCAEGSTVAHVRFRLPTGELMRSNELFLANLQDIETGRGQRRERRVREAQKSAVQFAAVLQELMELPDSEQLLNFLTYCDIPVIDAPRPPWARGARSPWDNDDRLRSLGERNLRAYSSLHAAAIGFCERHLKRMRRHCERISISGIPNFLHIALSIGNVVRGQVERLLIGLESTTSALTADDWHQHRSRLSHYLGIFREVMDIIDTEYLPQLQKRVSATRAREAIVPDLHPLHEICDSLQRVRARIESCRSTNLRIVLTTGERIPPGIFRHDMVHETRWPDWSERIRRAYENLGTYVNTGK